MCITYLSFWFICTAAKAWKSNFLFSFFTCYFVTFSKIYNLLGLLLIVFFIIFHIGNSDMNSGKCSGWKGLIAVKTEFYLANFRFIYIINGFGFSSIILLLFKAWVIFFVFPMLRLHKRKPHTFTLMLICSQVSNCIFKQFLRKQPSIQ